MKTVSLADYGMLLGEVKRRIRDAQYEALSRQPGDGSLYWDIGRMIGERQEGESWGKSVVERLAADLHREFPGISGFSSQNLWRMRQFYMTYRQNPKLSPLVREIGWTHNLVILMQCKKRLGARVLHPHDAQVRLVQERLGHPDREPSL